MKQYIGQLLDDRYEILETIGTGGMAMVYKARCHRLNRLVAVKVMKDEFSEDEEFRRRFRAEGEAVAMLSHPNIVQVFDFSQANDSYFIVMELIDGISLKQYMEVKGVLNWKETLHFASQIAKGLEHAHSRNIVHRDIKPHNVMVLKNGSVKVMDFGIAQVMNKRNTLTKEALGSVHYISPEQAKGSVTDNRSDIYSLGVVMYEMMTGRPPYDAESPVSVAIQHINGGAPRPTSLNPNIPLGMEQIIMKCMAVNPNDRFSSATELLNDLEEFRKNPAITFAYTTTRDDSTRVIETMMPSRRKDSEKTAGKTGTSRSGKAVSRVESVIPEPLISKKSGGRSAEMLQRAQKRREMEAKREAERSRVATIAVVSCSVVAVIAIVVFLVAIFNGAMINRDRDLVEVPYLTGSMYSEDFERMYPNFTIRLRPQEYDSFYVMGQIMRQEPVGGLRVAKGSELFITISMGEEPKVKLMEDLVGITQDRAVSFLLGQSLKALIKEEPSDEYPAGYVIRTDPAAEAELSEGQTVKVYVSTGPDKTLGKMPNVLNMDRERAEETLTQNGFRNVSFVKVYNNRIPAGYVVTQSETAYTMIDVMTHITLEISEGSEIETAVMPDVRGFDLSVAQGLLEEQGFWNIHTSPVDSDQPRNTVIWQSEDPDSVVALSKEIILTISSNAQTPATTPTGTGPVTKLVMFDFAAQSETCNLTICLKGHADQQVVSGVVQAGSTSFLANLTGSGLQDYDLYLNGIFYQTYTVNFANDG